MATKVFKIKELLKFQNKSRRKAGEGLVVGPYPFFTSSQVQRKWCAEADYKYEAIILGTGGGPSVHCSKDFSTSTDVFILAPVNQNLSAKYVSYFLLGNKNILERGFKGAGLKHISRDYVEKIEIPIPVDKIGQPDIEEQSRIVKILEEAEILKIKQDNADQKMDTVIQAIFNKLFGNPSEWNGKWKMEPLEDVITMASGATPSTSNSKYWAPEGLPWVSAKDMKADFVSDSIDHVTKLAITEGRLKLVPTNSILIVVRGMILAHTLPVSLTTAEVFINQDLKALIPKGLNGVFLWGALSSLKKQLLTQVKTSAHGTKKLDTADLLRIKVPMPDMYLQKEFEGHVRVVLELQKRQKKTMNHIESLFSSLLSRSLT